MKERTTTRSTYQATGKTATERALETYTELIIEEIKQFQGNWQKPWSFAEALTTTGEPMNLDGVPYQGSNYMFLLMYSTSKNYTRNIFGTLNRYNELNFCTKDGQKVRRTNKNGKELELIHVKKGEKSFPISYVSFTCIHKPTGIKIPYEQYRRLDDNEQKEYKIYPKTSVYYVFNIEQTNLEEADKATFQKICAKCGISADEEKPTQKSTRNPDEAFAPVQELLSDPKKYWRCNITSQPQNQAYYVPSQDAIFVPAREQFISEDTFCGTLFHEMAHSTGHPTMFNRLQGCGKREYAKEELIAELSAAISTSRFKLISGLKTDSVAYLQSWLKALKEEPDFLKKVLPQVNKASREVIKCVVKCAEATGTTLQIADELEAVA